ncbi:MAG TPA: M6 family metalloprotease domain-containing protein [Phycisphaerae bacterium]|nr:M6 family metalloprotease domain-containing protein [Phycisphaerae bacterium]
MSSRVIPEHSGGVCALLLSAFLLALCSNAASVSAMPASPAPIQLTQPDGTTITLRIFGYPEYHWFEDMQGFTVLLKNKEYVYAKRNARGELTATDLLVGKSDPAAAGLAPKLQPDHRVIEATRERLLGDPPPSVLSKSRAKSNAGATGTVKNLVVLCKFADHDFGVHTRSREDFDVLWNAAGGDPTLAPTGSVRDCFLENSYGQLTINSTVAAWVTLPHEEAYYAAGSNGLTLNYPNNAQGMVKDALDAVDPFIDFADFDLDLDGRIDAISIIHSGYGAETGGGGGNWIWSHRWALFQIPGTVWWVSNDLNSNGVAVDVFDYHTEPALWGSSGNAISRIGVAAHETGHFFGLPDYYDIDGGGQGAGSWGMMANAWGFDQSQLHPPHFSAYSKMQLGWLDPIVIDEPNRYTAPNVEFNPVVYRINAGYAQSSEEFLLIENRQPIGIETAMPQGGLAIWHIDEGKAQNTDEGYPGQLGWPQNNRHYRMAILQADGNYDLERGLNRGDGGDVYHGDGVNRIDESTVPNTDSYQFGQIIPTGNVIANISTSGLTMTFTYGDLTTCGTSSECGDGLYCNGVESCIDGLCLPPGSPCAANEFCAEDLDTCMTTKFEDDFEDGNTNGWDLRGTGSTATQGDWTIGDPVGTQSSGELAQPEDAFEGDNCAFTAQNSSLGNQDVDNGIVYMVTPPIDMAGQLTAKLAFTRWFYNRDIGEDAGDFFAAEVSDDGVNWLTVDFVPFDEPGTNQWTDVSVNIHEFIDLTNSVQIRFSASDGVATGQGSVIEAAVDNVFVAASTNCFANADCDDGDGCNGEEVCSNGACHAGIPLVCDDEDACNGVEFCSNGVCFEGTPVECDDGDDCNGIEFCSNGVCFEGVPVECDDGDDCNGVEVCSNGFCVDGTPMNCDDGLFCTGVESCFDSACESSGDPCTNPLLPVCDEDNDTCVECLIDDDCPVETFCASDNTCIAYGDGDFDADGDVDMSDYAMFQLCFGQSATPDCVSANLTGDHTIDTEDHAAFVSLLTGPL